MPFPEIPIDGNWVDICSLGTGFLYAICCKFRKGRPSKIISKQTALDFANGIAIFPLVVMSGSVVSSTFMNGLVESSKMSLCVAGFFALIAILEDKDDERGMFH